MAGRGRLPPHPSRIGGRRRAPGAALASPRRCRVVRPFSAGPAAARTDGPSQVRTTLERAPAAIVSAAGSDGRRAATACPGARTARPRTAPAATSPRGGATGRSIPAPTTPAPPISLPSRVAASRATSTPPSPPTRPPTRTLGASRRASTAPRGWSRPDAGVAPPAAGSSGPFGFPSQCGTAGIFVPPAWSGRSGGTMPPSAQVGRTGPFRADRERLAGSVADAGRPSQPARWSRSDRQAELGWGRLAQCRAKGVVRPAPPTLTLTSPASRHRRGHRRADAPTRGPATSFSAARRRGRPRHSHAPRRPCQGRRDLGRRAAGRPRAKSGAATPTDQRRPTTDPARSTGGATVERRGRIWPKAG